MRRINLVGKRFGKLTVLKLSGVDKFGQSEWLCECDCGNQTIVKGGNLRNGHTTSCGCRKFDRFSEDITGKRFGRLKVLSFDHMESHGRSYWLCKCDCGNEIIVRRDQLLSGHTKSCGCYALDKTRERATVHGLCNTRLYGIWRAMRYRCRSKNYERYGGRGVKVCDEWENFETFYKWAMNNGYEDGLSIDRRDNDGDYCPNNCRWVDDTTQANNKSTNRMVEYNGISHTISEWSRIFGIHRETLSYRIKHGNMRDFEEYFS